MKLTDIQIETLQQLAGKAVFCALKDYPDIRRADITGILIQHSGDILLETYEVPMGKAGKTKYYDIHVEKSK